MKQTYTIYYTRYTSDKVFPGYYNETTRTEDIMIESTDSIHRYINPLKGEAVTGIVSYAGAPLKEYLEM